MRPSSRASPSGEDEAIPPEVALAEHFGVSRTIVRESMKRLEEKGHNDTEVEAELLRRRAVRRALQGSSAAFH